MPHDSIKIPASALAKELGLDHQGADPVLTGVRSLEDAGPGDLSYLADKRYLDALAVSSAGAVIVPPEFADKADCVLVSQNPQLDAVRAMHAFARPQGEQQGVSPQAFVSDSAVLGPDCAVYPFAYIGPRAEVGEGTAIFPGCYVGEDCRVGKNCVLYPNVALMAGTELGDNVTIHPSVAVGGDGFGYVPTPMGIQKIPHLGRVVIGDNVEIGALTAVDRGSLSDTRIGSGTKLDNLVQVAHNVQVGDNCLFAAQVGVSGSSTIGNNVILAGQVGIAQHITIGDGATLGPQSGVGKDIPAGATMGGSPAMDRGAFLRHLTLAPKYPAMYRQVQQMEKRLAELERRLESGEKQ